MTRKNSGGTFCRSDLLLMSFVSLLMAHEDTDLIIGARFRILANATMQLSCVIWLGGERVFVEIKEREDRIWHISFAAASSFGFLMNETIKGEDHVEKKNA